MNFLKLWNICQVNASKLDEIKPDWFEDIDLDSIELQFCNKCLFHEIFNDIADYYRIKSMGLNPMAFGYRNAFFTREEYDSKLKQYWNALINQRKE